MSRAESALRRFQSVIKNNLSPSARRIIGAVIFLLILSLLLVYVFVIRGVGIKYAKNEDGTSYSVVGMGINFNSDIEIPETYKELPVTAIGENAFSDVLGKQIKSIKIPDTVTSIGWGAFSKCEKLESITIPNGVTIIEEMTFDDCKSLKTVYLGDGVKVIENAAFRNCPSLEGVVVPRGLTRIGNEAFSYCISLQSIEIPASVSYIGEMAFYRCTSLTSAYFENWEFWRVGSDSDRYTSVSNGVLKDPGNAARLLSDEYSELTWKYR